MGAFDNKNDITLPDPSDPMTEKAFRKKWGWDAHEQVIIKSKLSVADQKYVANNYATNKNADVEMKMGEGRYSILHKMIVAWTLTGNGQIVPLNKQTIDALPSTYSAPILDVIDKLSGPMSEEQQEDFLDAVNGHIEVGSTLTNMYLMKS
jgi:hypothetical protein